MFSTKTLITLQPIDRFLKFQCLLVPLFKHNLLRIWETGYEVQFPVRRQKFKKSRPDGDGGGGGDGDGGDGGDGDGGGGGGSGGGGGGGGGIGNGCNSGGGCSGSGGGGSGNCGGGGGGGGGIGHSSLERQTPQTFHVFNFSLLYYDIIGTPSSKVFKTI